jgi:putative membrane protein
MFNQYAGMSMDWLVLTLILGAGLLVVAVALLVNRPSGERRRRSDPELVLAHRFARGDIDAEEYQSRLRELRDE